jgi:hypothetical protein
VTKLVKGGIIFKSSSNTEVQFYTYLGILYLPKINVKEMQTEVLLHNMVSLEFNNASHGDFVTHYIALLHYLIDTPDDIHVLSQYGIIGQ